jgi:molecular chaperone DnaK
MSKVIGIDFGTTNCCISTIEAGNPVVIPNAEGSRTTPSMVAFTDDGERLVGNIAKRQAITNPKNTVFAIKRLMGRKIVHEGLNRIISNYPYKIITGNNQDAAISIGDKIYSPPEIGAIILNQLRNYAEDFLGEAVTDAVVTVPAYYDDTQRQATKDAGTIAGLNVLRIINEPTAASLAYGLGKKNVGRVAVFDLGGGTFDISILEIAEGVFQVKSIHGDTFLGGEDVDVMIMNLLMDKFKEENNVNLREDLVALQRLKDASEKAKIDLSTFKEVEISLPFIYADSSGPRHLQYVLTKEKLESMVTDFVDRTISLCREAIQDCGLSVAEVDDILLVGGMTKMPYIQRRVEEFFRKPVNKTVNPDEAVAIGAGIQGSILKGKVEDILLLDVIPLSLGIETHGGQYTKLIEKNTTIPTSVSEVFTTVEDYQPLVNIHVLQGERPMAKDNKSLARFELLGIPPARRGVPKIEVNFDIDANGILSVSAKDLGTGNIQSIKVKASSGLTEDDIQRIIKEAEEYKLEDEEKKILSAWISKAESLVYTTERCLPEFQDFLTEDELTQINKDIVSLRQAIELRDITIIQSAMRNLERSSLRITELMYKDGTVK